MKDYVQIKADKEFVNLIRKMKQDTYTREGLKLSDVALTKIISRKINNCNWQFDVGKWKIKLK